MYGEPVMLGLDCYAKSVGKEVDDLTDEEIHTIVEKVAGAIDETLIETVMQGQQVSETQNSELLSFSASCRRRKLQILMG